MDEPETVQSRCGDWDRPGGYRQSVQTQLAEREWLSPFVPSPSSPVSFNTCLLDSSSQPSSQSQSWEEVLVMPAMRCVEPVRVDQ